jgi:hypothetical protein
MLRDFFGIIKTLGVASNRRRREFEGSRINGLARLPPCRIPSDLDVSARYATPEVFR